MELVVRASGKAWWAGRHMLCAVGRAGIVGDKREGDGGTPAGRWPMREVLFRGDRLGRIMTPLPVRELRPADGLCDAPGDPACNRPVRLPYPAHCEQLWLDEAVYDVIVRLGCNDDPVVSGRGSAIFLHAARPDFAPTEGCVALAPGDLLAVLRTALPGAQVLVVPG